MSIAKVLITGGAGFVGTNLANNLINENYEVIIIDDLSSSYRGSINPKAIFVEGSVVDDVALTECFSYNPDYVVHLAALFANQNSVDHPDSDLMVNGMGTLKVLDFSKRACVKKVVYASSSCVYGNKDIMKEGDIEFHPDTPYAITKLLGEYYSKFWSSQYDLDIAIVRLFNVYGPGDFPGEYRSVIPNFIKLATNNKPLTITGSGNETRDFCFIDDTVDGICLILFNKTESSAIFNIATGIGSSIIEVANYINLYCNNKAGIQFNERRDWDCVIDRRADITKLKNSFGFRPKTRIKDGIKITCDWLVDLNK
ncbi:NAD-dependent epimerase/dehydratase family protein [Pseudothioglobus sp. nBUS_23]|uniref:NAD-dependent epimerase/dehydratase family protein n=1 Tax=Pseudothioglobus sp. nBUS_23 TaxID=3395318 RepID=UPI003EB732FC